MFNCVAGERRRFAKHRVKLTQASIVMFALAAAPLSAAAQQSTDPSCLWGKAQAMAEVAAEVCPHLAVRQTTADTIAAMQANAAFEPCYRTAVVDMARKKPTTDEERALFCVQASSTSAPGGGNSIMQRR